MPRSLFTTVVTRIEAIQFNGYNQDEIEDWIGRSWGYYYEEPYIQIESDSGPGYATAGDWVCSDGSLFWVTPKDKFTELYQKA